MEPSQNYTMETRGGKFPRTLQALQPEIMHTLTGPEHTDQSSDKPGEIHPQASRHARFSDPKDVQPLEGASTREMSNVAVTQLINMLSLTTLTPSGSPRSDVMAEDDSPQQQTSQNLGPLTIKSHASVAAELMAIGTDLLHC